MANGAIVVLDIGKSNAKLALVAADARQVIDVRTTPNVVRRDGPYPHFDVDALFAWVVDGLATFAKHGAIAAISTTTHGASAALLAGDGLAMPVLDYEHDGPDTVAGEYERVRGTFAETLSPSLPGGLNLGRQFYWQSRAFPAEFATVDAILPYPQYWAWRLSGAKASEVSSLGTHTDLWAPRAATYSTLAVREGWDRLFPPLVSAWDTVGHLSPAIAAITGIDASCRIVAGIHDSNASLLPHLLARRAPFAVVSTGTWMITFAPGGGLDGLDPARDCLANVDAFRRPVPSSRFMAGREFELVTGGASVPSLEAAVASIVARSIMALPSFVEGSGPFPHVRGRWTVDAASLSPEERTAAASLYAALVCRTCLDLAGAAGPIVIEGPFSRNALFLSALAQLAARPVIARPDATGTTTGAALLAAGPDAAFAFGDEVPCVPLGIDISGYAERWGRLANETRPA